MKTRIFIAGLFVLCALVFSPNNTFSQDETGTYIEESGEKQDSLAQTDIFDFSGEMDERSSSSVGLIVLVIAVALVGGGTIFFLRKKKKAA